MPIKAVLFDAIGTTVVEEDPNTIVDCFEKAFRDYGFSVDAQLVQANRGRDKKEMIDTIISEQNLPCDSETIYQSFLQHIEANLHQFKLRDGAEDLLHHLRKQNIKLGLGTGLSRDLLEKIMKHIGWYEDSFDYIGTSGGSIRGRPHADMILAMMAKLHLRPNEVLKVGDTVADIREGKNAGVVTAVILAGTQPETILRAEKPDFIIGSLSEIRDLIL